MTLLTPNVPPCEIELVAVGVKSSNIIRLIMNSRIFLAGLLSLTSLLAAATPGLTASAHNLPVLVKSGKCPKYAQIKTTFRYYEGGGEWNVAANTIAFASRASLVSRSHKVAVFRAPLKYAFRSCRGIAASSSEELNLYRFNFQNGNVIFRVTLPKDTPSNPSAISQARVSEGRPFVRWAIAD